jgi:hypothetical protein
LPLAALTIFLDPPLNAASTMAQVAITLAAAVNAPYFVKISPSPHKPEENNDMAQRQFMLPEIAVKNTVRLQGYVCLD